MLKWISAGLTFAAVVLATSGCTEQQQADQTASVYQTSVGHPILTGIGDPVGANIQYRASGQLQAAWLAPSGPRTEATASTGHD